MNTLTKTCPLCPEKFIVRHNRVLLGEVFVKIALDIELFNHIQSHVLETENARVLQTKSTT